MESSKAVLSSLLLCCTCAMLGHLTHAQEKGIVRGTVLDQTGAPVSSAKVSLEPLDHRPGSSLLRRVETDAQGRFLIDRLDLGTYKIFAMKEEAGYPNTRASFYSNDTLPLATLTPTSPEVSVEIQLGPRAAVLVGLITNSVTGAPVDAGFRLSRTAAPQKWLSLSVAPDYRLLLPPDTDVQLEVSAPGFKTWRFPSSLNLHSGVEMHLDVPLNPTHDANLHPSRLLVPSGYIGWVRLEYGVKAAGPVEREGGTMVFKFPKSGVLYTSSPGPERGAEDEYLYYSSDGTTRPISQDYRGGQGVVWGQYQGSRGGVMSLFGFFVGTEQQYNKYKLLSGQPGPIPQAGTP